MKSVSNKIIGAKVLSVTYTDGDMPELQFETDRGIFRMRGESECRACGVWLEEGLEHVQELVGQTIYSFVEARADIRLIEQDSEDYPCEEDWVFYKIVHTGGYVDLCWRTERTPHYSACVSFYGPPGGGRRHPNDPVYYRYAGDSEGSNL